MFNDVLYFSALSYNFAVDRYHPLVSKKGFLPSPFIDPQGYPKNFDWNPLEDEDLASKYTVISPFYCFYICLHSSP